jgi:conjugal transfer pilus assembly protein TraV
VTNTLFQRSSTVGYRLTLALAAVSVLIGCANPLAVGESKFTCEAVRGTTIADPAAAAVCAGVHEVYRQTNSRAELPNPKRSIETAKATATPVDAGHPSGTPIAAAGAPASRVVHVSVPPPITAPRPLMEPAQVIRIWVNYWIDSKGDLHQPGLIYTEVTPRRWAIGQPGMPSTRDLQPLQAIPATAPVPAAAIVPAPAAGPIRTAPVPGPPRQ